MMSEINNKKTTKVLVIKDNIQFEENLLEGLKTEGFETIEAKNGYIGLQKARKYLPNIIIYDTAMSKPNGYQVLENLRKDPATAIIPFILTGESSKFKIRRGMELGADDYLVKPITPTELSRAIVAQLKKRSLLQKSFSFQFQQVSQPNLNKTNELAASNSHFYSCPQIERVFNFIEAHYHEAISLRDVAQEVGFSPTYLTELVKRKTGITVNRWIIKRRLIAACTQLLQTDNSIEFIAESVGYINQTHFFSQFRQHYEMTPKVWRQTYR